MPLYEYKCDRCGNVFEVMQKFSDAPLAVHENCGGHVERLLSAPALRFKGTGWYVTDYARGGSGNGSPAGKSDSAKSESGKSDTKDSGPAKSGKTESAASSKPASSSPSEKR